MRQGLAIIGTGAALAALLAWQLATSFPESAINEAVLPRSVPAPGMTAPPPPASSAPMSSGLGQAAATVLARPLFSRDRRPGEEKPPASTAGTPAATDALPRLSGVLVSPTGRRAVFAEANGRSRSAGEGEGVGRYTIRSILPGMVVLSGPDGEKVLYTTYAKTPGPEAATR